MKKKLMKLMMVPGFAIIALVAPRGAVAAKVIERVIARVNNSIITERQFEQEKQKMRAQLAQDFSGAELETQFREQSKNLLRDLIDQDLMVQKAKDLDMKVEADIVKREDEIRKGAKLATIADLQAAVEKQGMVWEDFEDNIRRNLLMRDVIGRQVGSRILVSEQDKRKYYDAHVQEFVFSEGAHLAEILVATENRKPEEAEKRAKDAWAELKAGGRWPEVAKKYSDHQSASEGGDIGFFKPGALAPDLSSAIAKLDDNEYTDVIKTKFGYMILRVLERRKAGTAKFEEVEPRIADILYQQRMQPKLREYLRTLRKESFIFLASGYIDTGAERPSQMALSTKNQ